MRKRRWLVSVQAGVIRIAGVDVDLHVVFALCQPARAFPILRQESIGAFEGLLAAVTKFRFAAFQFYRVVHIARYAAKGIAVRRHAEAQPKVVSSIEHHDEESDGDGNSFHGLVSLAPAMRGRNLPPVSRCASSRSNRVWPTAHTRLKTRRATRMIGHK